MRLVIILRGIFLLLVVTGCESSWRTHFPIGTKLYEQTDHHYFGKVVSYEDRHDFHNGTDPAPSILIEQADDGHAQIWGSCSTCAATFQVVAPDGK